MGATVGHPLDVGHIHHVQGMLGVVHGLRFSPLPRPADWAYLTCSRGEVLVLVVDVRVGSPSFGRHHEVRLAARASEPPDTTATGTATAPPATATAPPTTATAPPAAGLYVGAGLAHGFTALVDDSVLTHLGPRGRRPEKDRLVHAFDPSLKLPWPIDTGAGNDRSVLTLPPEGADAPLLTALKKASRLPTWADWRTHPTERG
nr:dTDP-4-dehydrorhamnose 3,5-epimerase family protein [Nocardioides zeae]